ncbi:hypothetical protein M5689_020404 [Euphorbia peplus]|nr:hypothetical protein M5689_020404 [Euphorbia peplus]
MIRDAIQLEKIRTIKLCSNSPPISHLFFADNLFVFLEAEVNQVNNFMAIMEEFCHASGQKLNLHKSKICVLKNVTDSRARELSHACNISLTKCLGKYLGVPLLYDRITALTFTETVNRVQSKLSSWKSSSLSLDGRITMVNSVTSSTPNHIMQTNLLPSGAIDKLDKLNQSFIWGSTDNQNKMHLLNWDNVCRSKREGGTGIRKSQGYEQSVSYEVVVEDLERGEFFLGHHFGC